MDWSTLHFSNIEILAMIPSMAGAYLLSENRGAKWGLYAQILFLFANIFWITFALNLGHGGLLVTNGYFLLTSVYGIRRYWPTNQNDRPSEAAIPASAVDCCLPKGESNERDCKI